MHVRGMTNGSEIQTIRAAWSCGGYAEVYVRAAWSCGRYAEVYVRAAWSYGRYAEVYVRQDERFRGTYETQRKTRTTRRNASWFM